jgi:hypothetical protein
MKSRSRASAPTTVKRTVPPGRLPNAEYRTREYLTYAVTIFQECDGVFRDLLQFKCDERVLLSSSGPLPQSPPAEKATARKDQAGNSSASDGAGDRRYGGHSDDL